MILNIDTHSDCGTREFPLNMYGTGHGFPSNPPTFPSQKGGTMSVCSHGEPCVKHFDRALPENKIPTPAYLSSGNFEFPFLSNYVLP